RCEAGAPRLAYLHLPGLQCGQRDAGSSYPAGLPGACRVDLPSATGQAEPARRSNMTLDPTQRQHVLDWIKAKAPALRCAGCQGTNFRAQGVVGAMDIQGMSMTGSTSCPLVLLTCNHCGKAVFFSVATMALPPFNAPTGGTMP